MKRRQPSLTTKLAAALLSIGDIPYDDAKHMTAAQIISLYEFDHYPIRYANGGPAEPWNLVPRLIQAHRSKSAKVDAPNSAKLRRLEKKWSSFLAAVDEGKKPPPKQARWPKRKLQSRPFPKPKKRRPRARRAAQVPQQRRR